jgi:hypothetical protein
MLRLIVLAGVMAGEAAPAPTQTILWLGARAPVALDEAALLQAVAVYTRDLRIAVRSEAGTLELPPVRTTATAAQVVARLHEVGARLAFWCEAGIATGDIVLYTVDDRGAIEAHAISSPGLAGPELNRAVALKLRSVLAGTEPPPLPEVAGAPAGAAADRAPPPVAGATASNVHAVPINSSATAAPTPTPESPENNQRQLAVRHLSGAIGYRLAIPTGEAPLRQALAVEGSWAFGRRFEITLGSELAPSANGDVVTGRVSLFDLPIRIGARWIRPGRRLWLGAGAFGAVHLLSARATNPAGDADDTFTAAPGLGAEALARIPLTAAVAGELRLFAETTAPRSVFWVGGTPAIELGTSLAGGLGLAFPGL